MSRGYGSREIDHVIEKWMADVAPARAPERLLEGSFARTMATKQAPAYPWDWIRRRGRRRELARPRRRLAVGGLVAIVLAAGMALLALRSNPAAVGGLPPTASPSLAPSPTISPKISPTTVTPEATIPVLGPVGIATDGQSVWLFTSGGQLVRIDPTTNTVAVSVSLNPLKDAYQGLAVNKGGAWLTDWDTSLVQRFDPTTLDLLGSIAVGPNPKGVLATDAAVWVANTRGGSVARIDPATNTVVATVSPTGPTGPSGPNWLAEGLGSIWTGVPNSSSIVRIDEATNAIVARIVVAKNSPCGGLAVGPAAVWITGCAGTTLLSRIDPITNKESTTIELGGHAYTVALVAGAPWTSPEDGLLVRVNPTTNVIDRVVAPGPGYRGGGDVVVADGSLWLVDYARNQVIRIALSDLGG